MPRDEQVEGPAGKLRRFIDDAGITAAQAASALGVSAGAVSRYVNGLQAPEDVVRRAIQLWTRGKIKRDEWVTPEERAALEKVVPFSRAAGGR